MRLNVFVVRLQHGLNLPELLSANSLDHELLVVCVVEEASTFA